MIRRWCATWHSQAARASSSASNPWRIRTSSTRGRRRRARGNTRGASARLHDHGIAVNGSFVFGFDHDEADVFAETVGWIEHNRLECATVHILTPYPGTPLFRQLESEGRLLHRDWDRYDTAHAVFHPRHMAPEQLEDGYDWCYRRLFTHRSIWARRPESVGSLLPYLAGAYLYKRSNRLWHLLIRYDLTAAVWRPLIEYTRRRHAHFRRRLAARGDERAIGALVSVGV